MGDNNNKIEKKMLKDHESPLIIGNRAGGGVEDRNITVRRRWRRR